MHHFQNALYMVTDKLPDCVEVDGPTKTCLAKLQATDPALHMKRIQESKDSLLHDCYAWALEDSQLQKWQDACAHPLLWVRGDPGKGKTMLMIALVRELSKSKGGDVIFFFCQNNDPRLNNAAAILRGLIWKLVMEQPQLGMTFCKSFETHQRQLDGSNAIYALFQILKDVLKRRPETILVIDALDECNVGRERDLLLALMTEYANDSQVKWLVSSRNHLDIEKILCSVQHYMLSLELNESHVAKAVEAFIDHKTNELAEKQGYQDTHRSLLRRHMIANANSTFLWVALVCKRLADVVNYQIAAELEKLPAGLSPLYSHMLEQLLAGEDSGLAAGIMKLIVLAKRPLLIEELPTLMTHSGELNDEDSLLHLIKSCGPFTTIQEHTIYLIHQSVKDFFVRETGWNFLLGGETGREHCMIVGRSLSTLSKNLKKNICGLGDPGAPPDEKGIPQLKHLGYVCCFWVDHLAEYLKARVHINHIDESLSDHGDVHRFLLRYFLSWIELLALLGQLRYAISSLHCLEVIMKGQAGTNLWSFVHDAVRFLLQFQLAVEQAPLQIYVSGLTFAPEESLVRQAFVQDTPAWINPRPQVFKNWSALPQILQGHTDGVSSVVFSPDGKQLASASDDRTVRLWNAATEAALHTLKGHKNSVRSVVFSPDGKQLASVLGHDMVQLWDAATGALLQTLEGPLYSFLSISFSPDGKQLASASGNDIVQLWDAATGELLQTLEGHGDMVWSVAFSPDGKQLASGSLDETVRVWDAATGALLQTFEDHWGSVCSVAFSPDGKLASGSEDETVRVWDAATGDLLHRLEGHEGSVRSVTFSPDGKQLASGSSDMTVRVWDVATGAELQTFEAHTDWVNSVSFRPDGRQLASASMDWTVRLWDVATGAQLQTLDYTSSHESLRSTYFSAYLSVPTSPEPSASTLLSVSSDDNWIRVKDTRLIWLPPGFQPEKSAVHENHVTVCCPSGFVYSIGFTGGDFSIN